MRPLAGTLVLDVSRMLPGAILVRTLADLGARVIKVEEPQGGDPMRHFPPLAGGIGAGFREFFAGVESIGVDLKASPGAAVLRRLARHADVLIESFRPGRMTEWGLELAALRAQNPVLVTCSLPGFGETPDQVSRVGHDLNILAESGLLAMMPGDGVPRLQLADVATGMQAATSVMAALLQRQRTGHGMHVEQPIANSCAPFLAWAWADGRAGGGGMSETILAGKAPAYRLYRCADGVQVALGALEPKFWVSLLEAMGLSVHAGDGLDCGSKGQEASERLAEAFATRPAQHWLDLAAARGLPLNLVQASPFGDGSPGAGGPIGASPPMLATWPRLDLPDAPRLGQHTRQVLREMGVSEQELNKLRQNGDFYFD